MKKMRMLTDSVLLITYIVATIMWVVMILGLLINIDEDNVKEPSDLIFFRSFFIVMFLLYIGTLILSAPRILCVITLSEAAIGVWLPFHRKKEYSYKQFRNVYCGRYFHGNIAGVGRNVWYIVIAQRYLSSKELNQINQISNSEEIVKIRYTRKNYERLCAILPSGHVRQLKSAADRIRN